MSDDTMQKVVCPNCNGTGHIKIERPRCVNYINAACRTCHLLGYIRVPLLKEQAS